MRIAVSGSHGTGKSTLIAAFLVENPRYLHEPEAFELLGDDIALTESEGPDAEGLAALLEYTIEALASHPPGTSVIYERSPVDYLAYAAASRSIMASERSELLRTYLPEVRSSLCGLDRIVLLPVSSHIEPRVGEDEGFRERVDEALRGALIDDDHDLFDGPDTPRVFELSAPPDRWLSELVRRVTAADG